MLYQYIYYQICRFLKLFQYDAPKKAFILMCGIDAILLAQLYVWLDIKIGFNKNIDKTYWIIIPLGLIVVFINNRVFTYKERWKEQKKKFDNYSKTKNRIGGFFVLALIILMFYGLISAYAHLDKSSWVNLPK